MCSNLTLTHKPKFIFKSNRRHWKANTISTTFMCTPKANSKQKRVKKMQEHETGHAVREQLGKNTLFTPKSQF
ncbi:hypothetical protein MTR_3g035463 [Medicago truncatula]|uniref:Uncharacterized protein n=1 Tax=Medicago truncatula TaxID=3880 RepID=A0A072UVK8_MEDTR|nr:hypothetical protein MTR_3g035463 [Medicago truncatula]